MTKALITGITGQCGSYLTELLLGDDYEVHGIVRKSSSFNTDRIDHLFNNPNVGYKSLHLHFGDMTDASSLNRVIDKVKPNVIFNLAAQSHVKVSFDMPDYTGEVDGLGVIRLLDIIKDMKRKPRLVHMSTSEMFGGIKGTQPQNEHTPFHPRSPYAIAKLYGYWAIRNYREAYNLHASNAICFNNESPRRLETFVTRKITKAVVNIINGYQDKLYIGNLDSYRDWGYTPEYMKALQLIIQHKTPDDYVVATGETHTVREFIEKCFEYVNVSFAWKGEGLNEVGYIPSSGKEVVVIDERFFRPTEVDILQGDATKINNILGWQPTVKFNDLVKIMMKRDLLGVE